MYFCHCIMLPPKLDPKSRTVSGVASRYLYICHWEWPWVEVGSWAQCKHMLWLMARGHQWQVCTIHGLSQGPPLPGDIFNYLSHSELSILWRFLSLDITMKPGVWLQTPKSLTSWGIAPEDFCAGGKTWSKAGALVLWLPVPATGTLLLYSSDLTSSACIEFLIGWTRVVSFFTTT